MSHEAFLRTIIAQPDDDLPRLVYADWLDENDDPARAEFIRIQCELAQLPDDDAERRPMLEDREHELLSEHEPAWLGSELIGLQEWEFQRGFLHSITAGLDDLMSWPDAFHELTTVRDYSPTERLSLTFLDEFQEYVEQPEAHDLATPLLSRLEALNLSQMNHIPRRIAQHFPKSVFTSLNKLDLSNNRGLQHYSASLKYWVFIPNLQSLSIGGFDTRRLQTAYEPLQLGLLFTHCQIKSLAVHNCSLSTKSLCSLLDADFATHLKSLDVSANPIESDIWTAFQHANHQMRLERIDISGIGFSASSLHALLANKRLGELTELEINRFDLSQMHAEVLGESRYWAQAKEFRAYASSLQDESLELLGQTTGSRQLKLLDLAENYLHIDGVSHLCDAPWSRSLNWLSLSGNYLDDDAVNLFADSGHFPKLRTLHLAHPKRLEGHHEYVITGNGVAALANAGHLANLRVLTLNGAMIGRDGVDAALHSPHWKLSGLGIAGCELTVTTVNLMARSPRLARLTWLDLSMNRFLVGDSLLPLAESPYLSRLCELDIRGCGASDRVRQILRERLGPRLSD